MSSIDLFYQGEGLAEIEHIEFDGDACRATITVAAYRQLNWPNWASVE